MTTPTMKEILRVSASDREDAMTTTTPRELRLYRLADELRELTTPIGKEAATILERQASTLVMLHADLAAREAELARVKAEYANSIAAWTGIEDERKAAEQRAEAAERERDDERTIVNRIWEQLGSPSYASLSGRSIYDLIAGLQADRDEWKRKAEEAARDAKKLTLDAVKQRLLNWQQRTMNKSGDRLALDDFMGKESIDDLIDYVCDEYAAIAANGEA